MPKIYKSYLFGKPEYVKQYEKRQRAAARAAASGETMRPRKPAKPKQPQAKKQTPHVSDPWKQTKTKIDYLNERIHKYGDPDHVMSLLPAEMITDSGRIRNTSESRAFFLQHPELLPRMQKQIRKHPVSTAIRDTFETVLGQIYDEMKEIGKSEFFKITSAEFRKMVGDPALSKEEKPEISRQKHIHPELKGTDADTSKKMTEIITQWRAEKAKIVDYYEDQVRQGKMTAFSDDGSVPTTD